MSYNTDFFIPTKQKVRVTFGGWDGKSYNGEGCTKKVYKHPSMPDKKFVRGMFKGCRCYHEVTDERHPQSGELCVRFFDYFERDY